MYLPTWRAISGNLLGPKMTRASKKRKTVSEKLMRFIILPEPEKRQWTRGHACDKLPLGAAELYDVRAMQLWFARGSEVSIREQLVTQVVLGILSDDLEPGQRLPSTRELARRFHLHPNTVSAGYRQLQKDRWVEFRRGSGVYIRATKPETPPTAALALDQLIARVFLSARKL